MACIYERKNNDGTSTWRVQIRRKKIKFLNICFNSCEEAEEWVETNEEKYINNPDIYQKWINENRLNFRRNREFKRKT